MNFQLLFGIVSLYLLLGAAPCGMGADAPPGPPPSAMATVTEGKSEEPIVDVFRSPTLGPSVTPIGPVTSTKNPSAVEGIGMSATDGYVVLSGEIYREGETRQGIEVVQVRKGKVDIISHGVPYTLEMIPEFHE